MKTLFALASVAVLCSCANQPVGLTADQLESSQYEVTERRRMPIDFPAVQQNLFRHAALCGVTYTFQLLPHEIAYARVIYRPTPDAGWAHSVVLSLVLLQNRTIDVKAYSYYPGQLDRVRRMLSAMMSPTVCGIDKNWDKIPADDAAGPFDNPVGPD